MKQSVFTVQRRDDTRWHVCEAGLARSLASFGLEDDAIEYARDLAESWITQSSDADSAKGRGEHAERGASADANAARLIRAHA